MAIAFNRGATRALSALAVIAILAPTGAGATPHQDCVKNCKGAFSLEMSHCTDPANDTQAKIDACRAAARNKLNSTCLPSCG